MKKISIAFALFILVLAGCGAAPLEESLPVAEPVSTPVSADTTPAPAPATSKQPAPATTVEPQIITLESGNLYFKPSTITVKLNRPVTVNYTNKGGHTFTVSELGVDFPLKGPAGSFSFTPTKAGTFPLICAVLGHLDAGMAGTLVVDE